MGLLQKYYFPISQVPRLKLTITRNIYPQSIPYIVLQLVSVVFEMDNARYTVERH